MIRENNITTPLGTPLGTPLRTNYNANGSVRWRTFAYLNLFHWPMGKNSGNGNGVCRYVRARSVRNLGRQYAVYYWAEPYWLSFDCNRVFHSIGITQKLVEFICNHIFSDFKIVLHISLLDFYLIADNYRG